ncbi:MAG: dienelactone hydrolase family protein [Acidimicrobiaceae bacterium]|nr:dienelactone hydrolase family protein [Acidimicrobiaceae bacterium]
MTETERYRDRDVVYAGRPGEKMVIRSANPTNYFQAITAPDACEPIDVDAKLFLPPARGASPAVILAPGSLGVGENIETHAATLLNEGFVVCVIDPFGARTVLSTVANQTQFSFAASAFDVVATLGALQQRPEIDPARIAAQGHSRGGAAVLIAACRQFADAVGSTDASFAAVYAVYPWCGHQFREPFVGSTRVRAIVGDLDEWCSVQEIQGQINAMRMGGADAEVRVVPGAHHSFDRAEAPNVISEARVARSTPTVMLDDDGAMFDPCTGLADPSLVDYDLFVLALKQGFGTQGATIGSLEGQPELFTADMLEFHRKLL